VEKEKMRVLLLNPPFVPRFNRTGCRWPSKTRSDTVCYPIWLAYATGWLEKNGVEAKLIDAPARCLNLEDVARAVEEFSPDIVAVDTSTPSIINDVKVASFLKKTFNVTTVLVGPHVSALPEETLSMSRNIDYVITGEYDIALLELTKKAPESKIIRGKPFENLDALPFVSEVYKNHLQIKDYFYSLCRYPEVQIMSARGCPFMCNYCCWPYVFTGRNVRYRSVKNLVDELEYIKMKLPQVKDIIIEDDTFTCNRKRVLEVCEEIKRRKLDISWIVNARADVPYEVLKEMKSAGCRMLIVGYESGSQKILDMAKKGIKLETMRRFAKDVKKAGLQTMGCFMIGLLGETPETARQTFEFAKEVDPDFYFFSPATPFAGTEFYRICKEKGYLIAKDWSEWTDDEGYLRVVVSYPEFSNEEISKTIDEFLWKFAFRKKFIFKSLKKILRHPIMEGSRFVRSLIHGVRYYQSRNSRARARAPSTST
jgi:radical SAM superfamily enzyme YgiQ (UPF0313 family)